MAQTICFCNEKGGVGKTTLALSTAHLLSEKAYKVLFIDLDPQLNSTSRLGGVCNSKEKDLTNLFEDETFDIDDFLDIIEKVQINNATINNFFRVKASKRFEQTLEVVFSKRMREFILKKRLQLVQDHFDFIVIDTAPATSCILDNAIMASDLFMITVDSSKDSISGVSTLLSIIAFQKDIEKSDVNYRIIWNKKDLRHKKSNKYIENIISSAEYNFSQNQIRISTEVGDSGNEDSIPTLKASLITNDILNLTNEIIDIVGAEK